MVKKYAKYCKYCGDEISWYEKEEGVWSALNLDISDHNCQPSEVKVLTRDNLPLSVIKEYEERINNRINKAR